MPSLLPVPGTQDPGAGLLNGFILSPPSGSKQDLFTAAKRLIKMMKNPGDWGSPKMPPQCQQAPKSFPAFLGAPTQGAASAGVIQRCPEVRITHSSLLPTASTPTDSCPTCFYTISRHNGALIHEGGAPSHPITVITAVIRAAVDRKGESPRRP